MSDEQVVVGSPERDIHVQALVHLEKIDVSKLEDNENELFKMRAKLYRYHIDETDGPTWKERGVGDVKILKHKEKEVYRILMRRDKTLKLCANHFLTPQMEIKPHANSEKALVWSTLSDYADGEPNSETLCIRFGKPESAESFKSKFEECINIVKNSSKTENAAESDKLADELSSLNVKEEKDSNDNPQAKQSDDGQDQIDPTSKTNVGTIEKKEDEEESK